jgi:type IX secretion system PorP/SprF family membrane protein
MLRILTLLVILQIFITNTLWSQDTHWSQTNYLEFIQNPSLIGNYKDDLRLSFGLKDQWRNVTKPFQTYFFTIDTKIRKIPPLSIGTIGISDVAGDGSFRTNYAALISKIDLKLTEKISFAFGNEMGISNKFVDFSKFKFDNQYNGFFYDGNLATNEKITSSSFTNFSLAIGVSSKIEINKKNQLLLGMGYYNLTKPKETFYQLEVLRPIRQNYSISHKLKLKNVDLNFYINYSKQKSYNEILIGSYFYNKLKSHKIPLLISGCSIRNKDAVIFNLGAHIQKLRVNLSYDINFSKLTNASSGRGSFELSVQYLIKKKNLTYPIQKKCIDYY